MSKQTPEQFPPRVWLAWGRNSPALHVGASYAYTPQHDLPYLSLQEHDSLLSAAVKEAAEKARGEAYADALATIGAEFGEGSLNDKGLLSYQRCVAHFGNHINAAAPVIGAGEKGEKK